MQIVESELVGIVIDFYWGALFIKIISILMISIPKNIVFLLYSGDVVVVILFPFYSHATLRIFFRAFFHVFYRNCNNFALFLAECIPVFSICFEGFFVLAVVALNAIMLNASKDSILFFIKIVAAVQINLLL